MTDHDAIVRAICEHPDDDTPRLVYADFLEENGEPDRAAFIRAQVDLAHTPAWEPFAVLCRHHRTGWGAGGQPFRHTLPPLPDSWGIRWHEQAFRRGLGWRVDVRSLHAWNEFAPHLYDRAPVGNLYLNPPATMDDWRAFAAGGWVRRLRVVHLDGASPVEPIRALCDAPGATGITDIHFHRASSPGLPELVEDFLQSPLGRAVRGLHFRVGYESLEYLISALAAGGAARLDRLSLAVMGLTESQVGRSLQTPMLRHLTELDLRDNRLDGGTFPVAQYLPGNVHTLGLAGTEVSGYGVGGLAQSNRSASLRRLDLGRNAIALSGMRLLAESPPLSGLRSLSLRQCHIVEAELYHLVRAKFWPNLVELDLRENPITDGAIRHLLDVPVPADLTALLLDGSRLGGPARAALRRHFGERVILEGNSP